MEKIKSILFYYFMAAAFMTQTLASQEQKVLFNIEINGEMIQWQADATFSPEKIQRALGLLQEIYAHRYEQNVLEPATLPTEDIEALEYLIQLLEDKAASEQSAHMYSILGVAYNGINQLEKSAHAFKNAIQYSQSQKVWEYQQELLLTLPLLSEEAQFGFLSEHLDQLFPLRPKQSFETLDYFKVRKLTRTWSLDNQIAFYDNVQKPHALKEAQADTHSLHAKAVLHCLENGVSLLDEPAVAELTLNYFRERAGAQAVRTDSLLSVCARNHAIYVDVNGVLTHQEDPALPHFTGVTPNDRARYVNYPENIAEVIAPNGLPIEDIVGWIYTVYHRDGILNPAIKSFGYGASNTRDGGGVLNMSLQWDVSPAPVFFPFDGQTDVPVSWEGHESPSPLPDGAAKPVGFPVMIMFAPNLRPDSVQMTLYYNNQVVDCYEKKDGEGQETFYLAPVKPLAFQQKYTLGCSYVSGDGEEIRHTIEFTTRPRPAEMQVE